MIEPQTRFYLGVISMKKKIAMLTVPLLRSIFLISFILLTGLSFQLPFAEMAQGDGPVSLQDLGKGLPTGISINEAIQIATGVGSFEVKDGNLTPSRPIPPDMLEAIIREFQSSIGSAIGSIRVCNSEEIKKVWNAWLLYYLMLAQLYANLSGEAVNLIDGGGIVQPAEAIGGYSYWGQLDAATREVLKNQVLLKLRGAVGQITRMQEAAAKTGKKASITQFPVGDPSQFPFGSNGGVQYYLSGQFVKDPTFQGSSKLTLPE